MRFKTGDLLGRYRIVASIGAGGMGEVYEVEDTRLGVRRALKTFEPRQGDCESLRKRFCAEAKAQCLLAERKPQEIRLPSVHDYSEGSDGVPPYFVMDCIRCDDGVVRNLARAKEDCLANCDETIAGWFVDVCRALRFLHSENKLHRDIKPENILLDGEGHAVLADFGTLRFEDDEERTRMNVDVTYVSVNSREQFGTRRFWAPEILRGEAATVASDCYALGATFWWLLKGTHYDPSKSPHSQWAEGIEVDSCWARILPRLVGPYASNRLTDLDECIRVMTEKKSGPEESAEEMPHGVKTSVETKKAPAAERERLSFGGLVILWIAQWGRFADYKGRSTRSEFWSFVLFGCSSLFLVELVDVLLEMDGLVAGLYALMAWTVFVAVSVRRLHDTGRSWRWLLLFFVPVIGWIMLLVLLWQDSERGTNRYGGNPKEAYW